MVRNIELEQLVINKLTQEQFDNIEVKNPDELYFVTDAENDGGKGAQVEEMPEATEMNAGQVVQYVGETIPDIEATATITQTVGNSLTNLKVDAKKFAKASGLTEAGSLEFTYGLSNIVFPITSWEFSNPTGNLYVSIDPSVFFAKIQETVPVDDFMALSHFFIGVNDLSVGWGDAAGWVDIIGTEHRENNIVPSEWGITIQGERPELTNWIHLYPTIEHNWMANNVALTISNYGINYYGAPSSGDTLKVDYTPFVGGYEKGYFYVNQSQLSEESIEIAQTVGNSLANLSIDVNTFKEVVAPEFDTIIDFVAQVVGAESDKISTVTFDAAGGLVLEATAEAIRNLYLDKLSIDLEDPEHESKCNTLYIDYVNDGDMGIGYNHNYITTVTRAVMSEYGITIIGEPSSNNMTHGIYTPRGGSTPTITWLANGNLEVDILSYGISYEGTPSDGDTLSVKYFIPSVVAHNWNQINVQPASKGNGGIEWVTKLDLPADYPEQYTWECYPIWTIPGGIPDGTYEFYIQTLCGTDAENILAGIQNYTCKIKVKFYTENSTRRYTGSVSYVLDGSWTGDDNLRVEDNNQYFADVFKIINDTDLCFYSSSIPFASYVLGYINLTQTIPEIFKITAFKNIHTGELYYPQGQIYDGTNRPATYTNIYGELVLEAFSNPIYYPCYFYTRDFTINKNLKHICMSPRMLSLGSDYNALAGKITIYIESDTGGKFSATIDNSNPSKSMIYGLESTGDLSDVQIGTGSQTSYTYINLNPQNKQFQRIKVRVALTSPSDTEQGINLWYQDGMQAVDTFTPYTITKVSGDIDTTNIGTILQYTHETTEDYTQGYFYKAVGETSIAPASVDVTYIEQEGIQITVNDPDALVEKLSQLSGWGKNSIIEHINYGWWLWQYTENYVHWDVLGTYYDAELVNCFTVTPVENLDNGILTFNLGNFFPSREIITNGRWEQVNVQPASNAIQVTEMPEASEKNVGKILQYIGTPTSEYDQGYFYKNVVVSHTESSISASIMEGEPYADELNVSIDSEKLIDVINKELGLSSGLYRIAFSVNMGLTMLGKLAADGKVEKSVTFNWVSTLENLYEKLGITLTLTEDGSAPDLSNYDAVRIDIAYSDSQAICEWRQVNVQPSSGGGGEASGELPNLTGNEGRFLSNNGIELEWADIPTYLPAQEGHSGKFLTTDGTNLSWAEVSSGGGTVSGDYLPLSGGTLTGALKLHDDNMWNTDIVLEAMDYGAMGGTVLNISGGTIVAGSIHPSGQYSSLGTPYNQEIIDAGGGYGVEGLYYQRVCAKALNSGTTNDDIVIPSKSGTLALIEDIEAIMGDLSSALDTINGEEI